MPLLLLSLLLGLGVPVMLALFALVALGWRAGEALHDSRPPDAIHHQPPETINHRSPNSQTQKDLGSVPS